MTVKNSPAAFLVCDNNTPCERCNHGSSDIYTSPYWINPQGTITWKSQHEQLSRCPGVGTHTQAVAPSTFSSSQDALLILPA